MRFTLCRSPSLTRVAVPSLRLRLFFFEVRMWRRNALLRFTLPVPVFLKRLAAPLCVFSFGIRPRLLVLNFWRLANPDKRHPSRPMLRAESGWLRADFLRCLRAALCGGRRWLRRRCRLWFRSRSIFLRRQNQVQRISFLARAELHHSLLLNVFDQPLQNLAPETLPRHFPSAEEDGRLDLVSLLEEPQHMILLGFVVVVIHVDTKLHFLDRDRLLVFLGLALALFLLVQKLPVIHDAANRRLRGRGDFYQVEVLFAGHLERFEGRHDANLLSFVSDHAHFSRANTLIHADKRLSILASVRLLHGKFLRV